MGLGQAAADPVPAATPAQMLQITRQLLEIGRFVFNCSGLDSTYRPLEANGRQNLPTVGTKEVRC